MSEYKNFPPLPEPGSPAAVDAMLFESEQPRMSQWIEKVKRLPEQFEDVLILYAAVDGSIEKRVVYLDQDNDWIEGSNILSGRRVTHWLPIPPLPTQQEGES